MPILSAAAKHRRCSEDSPCRHYDPCDRCLAEQVLTSDDWYAVGFYRRVSDQYINQTPMGGGKGEPPVLTPRLEGWEAVLRMHGYPRSHWRWLVETAHLLHLLVHRIERVDWYEETGKRMRDITPEDVTDGTS